MKTSLIIYNPVSGRVHDKAKLFDLIQALSDNEYRALVHMTREQGDATQAVKELGAEADLIICCGGDGTLHEVINGLMELAEVKPLAYIPSGTTNDFAVTHEIPLDFYEACHHIKRGDLRVLDVGVINGSEYFSYIACFGLFTKTAYMTAQSLKNYLGYLAYLFECGKELGDFDKSYPMRIELDDEIIEDDFIIGAVVNSFTVAHFFKMPVTYEDLNDGKFEVILIRHPKNLLGLQEVGHSLLNGQYDGPNIIFRKASKVRFISKTPVAWSSDGEFTGDFTQVTIEDKPRAMKILV